MNNGESRKYVDDMVDDKNIIKEFIQATRDWYNNAITKEFRQTSCMVCGIKPSEQLKFVNAVEKQEKELIDKFKKIVKAERKFGKANTSDRMCYEHGTMDATDNIIKELDKLTNTNK